MEQTIDTVAVQNHLETTSRASENPSREVVGVLGVIELTGTAATQIVLAWKNDHWFCEHVQADGAAQLFLQALHRTRSTYNLTRLNVHRCVTNQTQPLSAHYPSGEFDLHSALPGKLPSQTSSKGTFTTVETTPPKQIPVKEFTCRLQGTSEAPLASFIRLCPTYLIPTHSRTDFIVNDGVDAAVKQREALGQINGCIEGVFQRAAEWKNVEKGEIVHQKSSMVGQPTHQEHHDVGEDDATTDAALLVCRRTDSPGQEDVEHGNYRERDGKAKHEEAHLDAHRPLLDAFRWVTIHTHTHEEKDAAEEVDAEDQVSDFAHGVTKWPVAKLKKRTDGDGQGRHHRERVGSQANDEEEDVENREAVQQCPLAEGAVTHFHMGDIISSLSEVLQVVVDTMKRSLEEMMEAQQRQSFGNEAAELNSPRHPMIIWCGPGLHRLVKTVKVVRPGLEAQALRVYGIWSFLMPGVVYAHRRENIPIEAANRVGFSAVGWLSMHGLGSMCVLRNPQQSKRRPGSQYHPRHPAHWLPGASLYPFINVPHQCKELHKVICGHDYNSSPKHCSGERGPDAHQQAQEQPNHEEPHTTDQHGDEATEGANAQAYANAGLYTQLRGSPRPAPASLAGGASLKASDWRVEVMVPAVSTPSEPVLGNRQLREGELEDQGTPCIHINLPGKEKLLNEAFIEQFCTVLSTTCYTRNNLSHITQQQGFFSGPRSLTTPLVTYTLH
ncbi:hypothetical protein DNTS_007743 [Danionella cerebrum]|uniref:Uncharacterized protein n=1 Tax=Danionella cerebrum TaxID=2873325 RepID=A0A553R844_9TELE|nr:hypothetical protein DNTS_007743 [Danionella translucida]